MKNIQNMNIWKADPKGAGVPAEFSNADVVCLNLSVRAYNCLMRAEIATVGQLRTLLEDKEVGLRRIRNLGAKTEKEIRDKYENFKAQFPEKEPAEKKRVVIRPAKTKWELEVDSFPLSRRTAECFKRCGIYRVEDLYRKDKATEPGWFAVRELFDMI